MPSYYAFRYNLIKIVHIILNRWLGNMLLSVVRFLNRVNTKNLSKLAFFHMKHMSAKYPSLYKTEDADV
jgi:hypothetical protein